MTDFRLLQPGQWGPVIAVVFYGMRSVPGRPTCIASEWRAMNSQVMPDTIYGPLSETARCLLCDLVLLVDQIHHWLLQAIVGKLDQKFGQTGHAV